METIELNTDLLPIFSGTYETYWQPEEYSDNGQEIYLDYKHEDLMSSILSAYQDHSEEIVNELGISFLKKVTFKSFTSPREYNFSTDVLYFDCEIDEKAMFQELDSLEGNEDFQKWLHDNFTSYDGFWSFTPNNYLQLRKSILTEGNEYVQSMGALCHYLAVKNRAENVEYYDSIEYSIYENWQGNGYYGMEYETQCQDCYRVVDYDNDFKCQNTECEAYEKIDSNQQSLL